VKDPNFPTSVSTLADVAQFYKDFEVVTADFDPTTLRWTPVTALTDDTALDTDLQLASDGAGNVLLSWLSNPDAELLSTSGSPSTLKYSTRAGGIWTPPAVLDTSLVGVSHHVAAVRGEDAFIVIGRVPDLNTSSTSVLDVYRRLHGLWSGAQSFAADGTDSRLPTASYDSGGVAHVVWQHGNDLVGATLDDPSPKLIRTGSSSLGFYDARLLADKSGNLVLEFGKPNSDGIANLFATVYYSAAHSWSADQQLIEDTSVISNVSGYFSGDGALHAAYLATQISYVPQTVTVGGTSQVIQVPQEGQTDLKTVNTTLPPPLTARLLNISTRMDVLAGDRVLIGGFIITGTDPKKVIIRGMGPSLSGVGVTLSDPTLELHQPDGTVITNDNWKINDGTGQSQEADIRATTIAPTNDLESAIVATLPPGNYTAILAGKNGGTGVGVVEVYDLAQGANSKLANISSRGFVDTNDNVMIGGLIVGGGTGGGVAKVIIRALAPSLSVPGKMSDPTLELHDSNGALLEANDNWVDSPNKQEIIDSTIPPPNNLESAIVRTLTPGNYTAIVRGAGGSTGIAVVEIYALN
jgi:hypothetical protein